ncbi:MAG: hypothetical protein ACRD21_29480, partial [Vicinamibacteria bacterium]
VELRSRAIRTLDRYESVLWVNDIPKHPLCHSIDWSSEAGGETPEVWIELKKPNLAPPPPPPVRLMPWVESEKWKDSSSVPVLRERVPGSALESKEGEDGFLLLRDYPKISASWERYLGEQWRPWAEKFVHSAPVQRVYNTLFSGRGVMVGNPEPRRGPADIHEGSGWTAAETAEIMKEEDIL